MTHFIKKCVCGKILEQCRCPSKDKPVSVAKRPCIHMEVSDKLNVLIPMTIDFQDDSNGLIGHLISKGDNPQADFIYMMMEQGYGFEILPSIQNGKLVSVSISTPTVKKTNLAQ